MFSNESETLCHCFDKLEKNIFFVTDIRVPRRMTTKPNFLFPKFSKILRHKLYSKVKSVY